MNTMTSALTEMGYAVSRLAPLTGIFPATLYSLDHSESKYSQDLQLRWTFSLADEEHRGDQVSGYSPQDFVTGVGGQPMSKAAIWACTILAGPLPDPLLPSSLYGKPCRVEIESIFKEDGTFKRKVKAVLPPE